MEYCLFLWDHPKKRGKVVLLGGLNLERIVGSVYDNIYANVMQYYDESYESARYVEWGSIDMHAF
jgi:hypothetical protein